MKTALYIIWFLFPAFFFFMALWGWLEGLSKKNQVEKPADSLKQGIFVLGCVVACIVIDQYMLESIVSTLLGDILPLGFFQVILLPLVLYLGALVIGPSKIILIGKAPHPTARKERRLK